MCLSFTNMSIFMIADTMASTLLTTKYGTSLMLETEVGTTSPKSVSDIELILIFTLSSHVTTQHPMSGEMFSNTKGCCVRKGYP